VIKIRFNAADLQLELEGHAGYALKGTDVICAGVSVLAETLALNLERLSGAQIQRRAGFLRIKLRESAPEVAVILLGGTLAGLRALAEQYPENIAWEGEKYGA